jgi:subtilisin-like proprotein convertase family protein
MFKYSKLLLVSLLMLPATAGAQVFTYNFSGINAAIPDGDLTGLANSQSISAAPNLTITDINVSLSISGTGLGGFNGDLFVTLQHDDGFSILLNRPGARSGTAFGYGDSGLNVTFDDAATGDVHGYRQVLNSDHTTPLPGSLTGTWSPDARAVDPGVVLDTSARNAFLDSFNGAPIGGTWSLFVTDLSSGATQQLDGWAMQITAVPEPAFAACAVALGLLGFAFYRRLPASTSIR